MTAKEPPPPAPASRAASAKRPAHELQYWMLGVLCVAALAILGRYLLLSGTLSESLPKPRGIPIAMSGVEPRTLNDAGPVRFVDATEEAGIAFVHTQGEILENITQVMGSGAAFTDYDLDGDLDLYIVNGSKGRTAGEEPRNRLYRNYGNGTFADVTAFSGTGDRGWGMGCALADYDNDGDVDIYVTNLGPNVLYRNNGDGTFSDVTGHAGVAGNAFSTSAAFADIDLDGRLDLIVANYLEFRAELIPQGRKTLYDRDEPVAFLPHPHPPQANRIYRNKGDGVFEDVSARSGLGTKAERSLSLAVFDFDNDADPDLYVTNDLSKNALYRNLGDGTFEEIGLVAGVDDPRSGMGLSTGDFDNDGDLDILTVNWQDETNVLFKNLLAERSPRDYYPGSFEDITVFAGLAEPSLGVVGWGGGFLDFDNDGYQDLFIVTGHTSPDKLGDTTCVTQRPMLFHNRQDGVFQDWAEQAGLDRIGPLSGRGATFGDYDNDGDLDIFIVQNNARAILLKNEGGNRNNWLKLRLRGTISNKDSIGARVELVTNKGIQVREVSGGSSYLSQHSPEVIVGLGSETSVKLIRVGWPSGITWVVENVAANQPAATLIVEPRL